MMGLGHHIRPMNLEALRRAETTRAIRSLVTGALLVHPCACGQAQWHVTHTAGRVRYLQCRNCGARDKLVLSETPSAAGKHGA